jgi:N-formylglutamate amidohydrolase
MQAVWLNNPAGPPLGEAPIARYGKVWHSDCHSMPSVGDAMSSDNSRPRPDLTVSERMGTICAPEFLRLVVDTLCVRVWQPRRLQFGDQGWG